MGGKRRALAQAVAVVTLAAFLIAALAPAPALAAWRWDGWGGGSPAKKPAAKGGLLGRLWGAVKSAVSKAASAVKSAASAVAGAAKSAASAVASAAKSAVSKATSAVKSAAKTAASAAKSAANAVRSAAASGAAKPAPSAAKPSSASREHGLPPAGWSFAQSDLGKLAANAVVRVGQPILRAVSEHLGDDGTAILATGQTVVAQGADVYSSAQPVLEGARRLPKPWMVTGASPDAGLGLANADGSWYAQRQYALESGVDVRLVKEPAPRPQPKPQPVKRPEPPKPQPQHQYRTVRSEFAGPERPVGAQTRTWVERTAPAVASRRTETLDFGVVRQDGPRREGNWLVWDIYRAVGIRTVTTWAWRERQVAETARVYETPYYYHVTVYRDTLLGGRVVKSEVVSRYDSATPHRVARRTEVSTAYGPWRDRSAVDFGPIATRTVRSERREPVAAASEPPKPQPKPPKVRPVITITDAAKYEWSNYSQYRREIQARLLGIDPDSALARNMRVLSDEELRFQLELRGIKLAPVAAKRPEAAGAGVRPQLEAKPTIDLGGGR